MNEDTDERIKKLEQELKTLRDVKLLALQDLTTRGLGQHDVAVANLKKTASEHATKLDSCDRFHEMLVDVYFHVFPDRLEQALKDQGKHLAALDAQIALLTARKKK